MVQVDDLSENMASMWKTETSRYNDRLQVIKKWTPIENRSILSNFPDIPLEYKPCIEEMEAIRATLYITNQAAFAQESTKAFGLLWDKGLFNTIFLSARLIYEIWGSVHYTHNCIKEMNDNFEVTKSKIMRLIMGSRSNVELPWYGTSSVKSIHIMDFIRSLNDVCPEAEENYNFLCEACHPNFIRQFNLYAMGPNIDNWDNKKFNNQAHKLLNQTLFIIETAHAGIALDIKESLELTIPFIHKENPNINHS